MPKSFKNVSNPRKNTSENFKESKNNYYNSQNRYYHERRAREKRHAFLGAASRGLVLCMVFILVMCFSGLSSAMLHGDEYVSTIIANGSYNSSSGTYEDVALHSFRFSEGYNFDRAVTSSFKSLNRYASIINTLTAPFRYIWDGLGAIDAFSADDDYYALISFNDSYYGFVVAIVDISNSVDPETGFVSIDTYVRDDYGNLTSSFRYYDVLNCNVDGISYLRKNIWGKCLLYNSSYSLVCGKWFFGRTITTFSSYNAVLNAYNDLISS